MFRRASIGQGRLPIGEKEQGPLALALFVNGKNGVIILDAVGKIVAVNPSLCSIAGESREKLVGTLPKFLFSGGAKPDAYRNFIHDLITKGEWQGRADARIADGSMLPVDMFFCAIPNGDAEANHFVGIVRAYARGDGKDTSFNPNFDPLTGLLSEYALRPRLEHILARAEKYVSVTTLAYINIDNFSKLNSLGADIGDSVLQAAAGALKTALDKTYAIARLRADIFAVVIQDVYQQDEIKAIVDRIFDAISSPDAAPAAKGGLSVSIGVASYPFSGDDVDSLLDAAKEAADRSKAAGGGRITYHKLFTEVEQENL